MKVTDLVIYLCLARFCIGQGGGSTVFIGKQGRGMQDRNRTAGKTETLFREAWFERGKMVAMKVNTESESATEVGNVVRTSEGDLPVLQFLGFHPCH